MGPYRGTYHGELKWEVMRGPYLGGVYLEAHGIDNRSEIWRLPE